MSETPTHISHYEIRRVLGEGGMGTVYLATDTLLRRPVALKVLRADTEDQRERFRREARIVARLQHPNIVAIYTVGEHEQQPFIAMEYIEGEPLSEGIRRRAPWNLQRKLLMAADLCAGLAFAHRAGVIHRDVKPSNLIVSSGSGTVRLLDFGIARGGGDIGATMGLTMQGNIVGTLNYMSPEQITGQDLDHRSDIFAVGLVLYELLTYEKAFPGNNLATLTYQIVHGSPTPLQELLPDPDPALCAVVERAMARSPDDRYPHLDAMRTDLLRVASAASRESGAHAPEPGTDGHHTAASPPLIWSHALDRTESSAGPDTPRSTAPIDGGVRVTAEEPVAAPAPPVRGARWPLVAGAAGVVLASILAVVLWTSSGGMRRDGESTPPAPVDAPRTPGETTADPRVPVTPAESPESSGKADGTPGTSGTIATPSRVDDRHPRKAAADAPVAPVTMDTRGGEGARDTTPVTPPREAVSPPPVVPPPVTSGETRPVTEPTPPVRQAEAAGPSDESLIQTQLTNWARAYSARDARAVDAVQPGAYGALQDQFSQLRSVELALSGCRISVDATSGSASADCAESFVAELRVGGRRTTDTRRRVFSLTKAPTWRITATRIVR
ncbi:MAG: protein kinase [Acidobacteria bacterium]|nr:protein kinase [Acidobacteriota bacterium]